MNITFDPASHAYWDAGRPVPGVTDILAAGKLWCGGDALDRGGHVHQALALLDEGDLDESTVKPEWLGYVTAYKAFLAETKFKPSLIETPVWHENLGFAGTLDRVGALGGRRLVLEIKTGTVPAHAGPQTAAYALALGSSHGLKITARAAVELHEDGTFKLRRLTNPADLTKFLKALHTWRQKHAT